MVIISVAQWVVSVWEILSPCICFCRLFRVWPYQVDGSLEREQLWGRAHLLCIEVALFA